MTTLWLVLLLTVLLVLLGSLESFIHQRNLNRIGLRIHVNGTRGKSSVTRLIAAGLRAGGIRTTAKTTGTLPRFILPDGSEYPVYRTSRPNVIEQVRIVSAAVETRTEALVIECMALQPYLQWISEAKLIRATHGVITNARADHLDVMGPTAVDVARALSGMIPPRGKLYLGCTDHGEIMEKAARERQCALLITDPVEGESITDEELMAFSYIEHRENIALALKVCRDLGVARETALHGMQRSLPDPGATTVHEIDFFGRRIVFINAFAANDPESTEKLWNLALRNYPEIDRRIALFNCRRDRQDRSRLLGQSAALWTQPDRYVLMGTGTFIFARAAARAGLDMINFSYAENLRPDDIFEVIVDLIDRSALVVGMGNIGGAGLDTARYFRNRSVLGKSDSFRED